MDGLLFLAKQTARFPIGNFGANSEFSVKVSENNNYFWGPRFGLIVIGEPMRGGKLLE